MGIKIDVSEIRASLTQLLMLHVPPLLPRQTDTSTGQRDTMGVEFGETISVWGTNGQLLIEGASGRSLDLSGMPKGVFWVFVASRQGVRKRFLVVEAPLNEKHGKSESHLKKCQSFFASYS